MISLWESLLILIGAALVIFILLSIAYYLNPPPHKETGYIKKSK